MKKEKCVHGRYDYYNQVVKQAKLKILIKQCLNCLAVVKWDSWAYYGKSVHKK